MSNKKYGVIGIMSGTSLDGVDIVYATFEKIKSEWKYQIEAGETYSYPEGLLSDLKTSQHKSGLELSRLNVSYGTFLASLVNVFIDKNNLKPDFIASHGYTVFHEPDIGHTLQIGSGAEIAANTGVKTICDFRTTDVALRGQGAPLVPVGDELMFGKYIACLNLGGFSNISYDSNGSRVAFDICPVNYVFNYLANKVGEAYDESGSIARSGSMISKLYDELNDIDYYTMQPPKSLGREFVEEKIFSLFEAEYHIPDIMHTFSAHVSYQVSAVINKLGNGKVLVTGGGAYNSYLMEQFRKDIRSDVVIPDKETIDFKEALIFAFLGVLRTEEEANCLSSVTGAKRNNTGGAIYI